MANPNLCSSHTFYMYEHCTHKVCRHGVWNYGRAVDALWEPRRLWLHLEEAKTPCIRMHQLECVLLGLHFSILMVHGNYTASDRNNLGLHGLAIFTEYEIYLSSSTVAIVTVKNPQPPHGIVYHFPIYYWNMWPLSGTKAHQACMTTQDKGEKHSRCRKWFPIIWHSSNIQSNHVSSIHCNAPTWRWEPWTHSQTRGQSLDSFPDQGSNP